MSSQPAKKASGSSNREAKGFLLLLLILFLPFFAQYAYRAIFYKPQPSDLSITYLSDTCEARKYDITGTTNGTAGFIPLKKRHEVKQADVSIELNEADSSALETLPGIGPAFASRIIKYRTLLGGYVKMEQLKEVYGMPEETYERVKPLCTINTAQVKMIEAESLWQAPYKVYHPYLSKELKAVINEKKKAGAYSEPELKILIEESNKKLGWYMSW